MTEPRDVDELLAIGERVLGDSTHIFADHDNRMEAEGLLAHVLGVAASELAESGPPTRLQRDRYLALVARRAAGEPFPFLTGSIEFYGLDLRVRRGAFVPRPSSELTVTRALRLLRRKARPVVADVCTGAGPIALAIAAEVPQAEVWGCDIADEGLRLARANARRLGIANVAFRRGDLYDALPARLAGTIDLVTAHVPYVPSHEVGDLPAEVREHEPDYTLTDRSADGFELMRRTVAEARSWLRPRGWLLLEMSEDFAAKVERLCLRAGFEEARTAADEDRLSVVVEARAPSAFPNGARGAR